MAKVLIIEDDADVAEMSSAFFRQKGHETLTSDDPQNVLDTLSSGKMKCDVIICDYKMPQMTGIDFVKRSQELGLRHPIIIITSNRAVETAIEAIQAGAYDFVVKPLHFPQLFISVERALHFSNLKNENQLLKEVLGNQQSNLFPNIIGKSQSLLRALDLVKRVAPKTSNIFISGESGTGKEVIAKAIHQMSPRAKKPFIAINCSAIPENLLESELFGYAKGAFTGAADKKVGLFEEAEGGTLFLDEIGDMSGTLQAKLLRVLQERKIRRIGENQQRAIDVRVLSATHKNLKKEIQLGHFREDLFFRLNVIPIHLVPLRERREDIPPLADFFLKKFSVLNGVRLAGFSKEATEWLIGRPWPGNVRELENTIERAVVLCEGDRIEKKDLYDLQDEASSAPVPGLEGARPDLAADRIMTLDEVVKSYVKFAIAKNKGAKEKTAKDLAIDRKTLYRKLQEIDGEQLQ